MALDPIDANILYRSGNGIHQSTDGGESWQRIDGPSFGAGAILINPVNRNVMYVLARINGTLGLHKSTEGGTNWRLVLEDAVWADMDRANPDTLYAVKMPGGAFVEGIFKTTNGGGTWAISLESRTVADIVVHPIETDTIYVGGNGLRKSTDGGRSWNLVGLAGLGVSSIVLDSFDVNILYARVNDFMIGDRLYRSTDGGVNWERLPTDLYGWLAVDPKDRQILYVSTWEVPDQRGIHKSTDGGLSWRWVFAEFMPVGNVVVDPSDTRAIYAAGFQGTAKSTDGGESWTIYRRGFVATNIQRVLVAPIDTSRIYASPGRFVSRSTDGGESWSEMRLVESDVQAIDPSNSDILYGVGQGGLNKSTDGGETWRTILREGVGSVAVDPNDPNILYAAATVCCIRGEIFKSTDAGTSWNLIAVMDQIITLAIDPKNSQTIYAATQSGLHKSTNGGLVWYNYPQNLDQ